MTEIPDNQIIQLKFKANEAAKVIEVFEWAKQTPNPVIKDQTFGVNTLDGLIEAMKNAVEAGLSLEYMIRLNCHSMENASYAKLRWG